MYTYCYVCVYLLLCLCIPTATFVYTYCYVCVYLLLCLCIPTAMFVYTYCYVCVYLLLRLCIPTATFVYTYCYTTAVACLFVRACWRVIGVSVPQLMFLSVTASRSLFEIILAIQSVFRNMFVSKSDETYQNYAKSFPIGLGIFQFISTGLMFLVCIIGLTELSSATHELVRIRWMVLGLICCILVRSLVRQYLLYTPGNVRCFNSSLFCKETFLRRFNFPDLLYKKVCHTLHDAKAT